MATEGISSDSKFEKVAELPGTAAPCPYHIARVLYRCMKADRCLEWLEKASPQTPNLKRIAELPGFTASGPHHVARILDRGMKADSA